MMHQRLSSQTHTLAQNRCLPQRSFIRAARPSHEGAHRSPAFKGVSVPQAERLRQVGAPGASPKQFRSLAGETLAKLMDAKDPGVVARDNINLLTDEFFIAASTFLDMAKKERNDPAAERLEIIIRAAHEAKLATLRPEIQLLNRLLAAGAVGGAAAREKRLATEEARAVLALDNGYFVKFCKRMAADVASQPEYPGKQPLLTQLSAIELEAGESLAAAAAAAPAAAAPATAAATEGGEAAATI